MRHWTSGLRLGKILVTVTFIFMSAVTWVGPRLLKNQNSCRKIQNWSGHNDWQLDCGQSCGMWLIIFKILMFIYVDLFDLFDPTGRRHATGRLLVSRFYIGLANCSPDITSGLRKKALAESRLLLDGSSNQASRPSGCGWDFEYMG
jgi:hypothetical protein